MTVRETIKRSVDFFSETITEKNMKPEKKRYNEMTSKTVPFSQRKVMKYNY